MKALLTIAACRGVVERVKSVCIQLSLIPAAGHPLHQAVSLLLFCFFCGKKFGMKCLSLTFFKIHCFFVFFWFLCFARSTNKILIAQKLLFPLFISLFLFSCSLSFFFSLDVLVKVIWWQRTKHVTKRNECRQWWMVPNVWKGGLLLACFWAWLKVWVDGPESTKESVLADDSWLGLAAMVCFLWLSDLCVWHRQLAGHPLVNAYHHLTMFSLHSYSPHVYPPSSTRGKKLLEGLGNLRRWGWT